MMPERLTSPTVGFRPTIPLTDEGHTTEPLVSVPIAPAQKFAETAAPDPEEDPHGFRSTANASFLLHKFHHINPNNPPGA